MLPVFIYNEALYRAASSATARPSRFIMLLINLVIALVYLRAASRTRCGGRRMSPSPARCRRIALYVFVAVVLAFFALPMLWLVTAPFDAHTRASTVRWPDFTLDNFRALSTTRTRSPR